MKWLIIALGAVIWLVGCCDSQRTEPTYPKDVAGWRNYKEGTTKLRGSFVLRKGEQTDNGKLQITVLELIPPKCTGDTGDFSAQARVNLGFTRVSDQQVLCSETFPENGGGSLSGNCGRIPDEFGIYGVGVRAINIRDGWVFFFLDGDY